MTSSDARTQNDPARALVRTLDPDQRRAVTSSAPLLAVIAGAGSGKTTVLTRRVAWRCLHGDADPMHTAVITFTRQAAAELRRRLRNLGIDETVLAGTFHAICLGLLQQHWERTGRRAPTVVQDRRRLIGEVIGPRRGASIDELAAEIDWARARNIPAQGYASASRAALRSAAADPQEVARVMSDLEALKRKKGVVDLDDLLSLVIDAADKDADFAGILHWRLRHLFVDEAQDLNPLQRAVLDVLRGGRDDLTLVGDPSQSIYGFNGSDPTILHNLEHHFPGIEVVRLDTNYRCTPQIVRAGLTTLAHLGSPPPPLRSGRPDGVSVTVYGFDDEESEAAGVRDLLQRMYAADHSWRNVAVLARTNAQLATIRTALESVSIPVRFSGSSRDDPLQQCVREVGDLPSRARLAAWARDVRLATSFHAMSIVDDDRLRDEPERNTLEQDEHVRSTHMRVASAVDEFLADGGSDGRSFLAWVRTQRPFEEPSSTHGVDLLTFHAAKGREWDAVILVGCEDGLMPHSSARTQEALDEETRLAYVAVTRAADRLVLTYAHTRKGRRRSRSPLIDGLAVVEPVTPPSPEFVESLRQRQAERNPVDAILDELVSWRLHAARVSGVDPRLICPDDVLQDLARTRPTSVEELAGLPGLGAPLVSRVGPAVVRAIERGINRQRSLDRDSSR